MSGPGLFAPYRAVGLVCSDTPPFLNTLGTENFVVVAIDKSFQVLGASNLSTRAVSPPVRKRIRALVCVKEWTFTACGGSIVVWQRCRQIGGFTAHATSIKCMIIIGSTVVTASESEIKTWDVGSLMHIAETQEVLPQATMALPVGFALTSMVHPPTYLNKVVVSAESGALAVWNVATAKLKFVCDVFAGVSVTALTPSPAVDILAVGLANGNVALHNIKTNKTMFTFAHADADAGIVAGHVTALAFCTDPLLEPYLISATERGTIAVWNLNTRSLQSLHSGAHEGAVSGLICLPRSSMMISTGARDNALRQWVIDASDGSIKQLRARVGHAAPPTVIRHFRSQDSIGTVASGADAMACEVLSAGADKSLRMFHTALDRQNRELSQGHLEQIARKHSVTAASLRAPNVTAVAICDRHLGSGRDGLIPDVITAHEGDHRAYTWSYANKAMGATVLSLPNTDAVVTAVAISSCGFFGFIGSSDGKLLKFNLQSGLYRGCYPPPPHAHAGDWGGIKGGDGKGSKKRAAVTANPLPQSNKDVGKTKGDGLMLAHPTSVDYLFANVLGTTVMKPLSKRASISTAHKGAVTGIAVDVLNSKVYSTGLDAMLRVWDFVSHTLLAEVEVGVAVNHMEVAKESGLLACVCDDFIVRMYDMTTFRLVRSFFGHSNRITDISFSVDGRWLMSSSMDGTVRVYDIPTGRCIDWITFPSAPTSISMAPTSEYLITSHADSVGLFMWTNTSHFGHVFTDVVPLEPRRVHLPLPGVDSTIETGSTDAAVPAAGDVSERNQKRHKSVTADATGSDSSTADIKVHTPADGCTVAFSSVPVSQWKNLPVMELIYQRNKPTEPPKEPEKAPFFLPTLPGINPVFVRPTVSAPAPVPATTKAAPALADDDDVWASAWVDDAETDAADTHASRVITAPAVSSARCVLTKLLLDAALRGDVTSSYDAVFAHLIALPAGKIDAEFRSIHAGLFTESARVEALQLILAFFAAMIRKGQGFELLEAQLGLCLRIWGDFILTHEALQTLAAEVKMAHSKSWSTLQALIQHNLCLIQHFSNIQ